jgi:hypothetical protein
LRSNNGHGAGAATCYLLSGLRPRSCLFVSEERIPALLSETGRVLMEPDSGPLLQPNNAKTVLGTLKQVGRTLHRKTSAISDRHPTFATGSQKRRRFISSAVLGCNWIRRILMPAAAAVRQPSQSAKRQSEWPVLNRAPLLCGCTSTGVRMPDQTPHQVVDISSWPLDEEFGIFPWHQPCPPGEKRAQDY